MPHCPLVATGWRSQVAEPAQAPGRQPEPRPPPQGDEGAWEQPLALQGICLAEQEAQRAHRQAAGLGSRGKHYPDSGHCQHLAGSWALPAWGSSRLPAGWTLALHCKNGGCSILASGSLAGEGAYHHCPFAWRAKGPQRLGASACQQARNTPV